MKNVLVIDDDTIIGKLIDRLSQLNGAATTIARSGEEARSILQSGARFNVIFLDLIIPKISGWDILTAIKDNPATKDTPVVIMTGASLSKEEREKLQNKVSTIIDKRTFDMAQIEDILKSIS